MVETYCFVHTMAVSTVEYRCALEDVKLGSDHLLFVHGSEHPGHNTVRTSRNP